MKFLAVSVLVGVLVPLLALAQEKVELNAITSVKVNGSTVEITGTKKPNFTTFTMTDPPRLVVDISEAILKGVPEETRVNNGFITGLRSANYGSESSSIARVLIGYDRDVETDIQVSGNVLMVKVLEGGAPLVAQAMPEPTQPVQGTSGTAQTPPQAGTPQTNPPTQPGTAQETAQADAAAKAKAQADAATAKKLEDDRRKQEEAARAEAAKKAEDDRRAQAQAAADEKKRQQETARAEAEAKKQAEAEERKRKEDEARAAVEARRQQEADDKKRRAEEAEQKRLAALEEKKHQQDEARAATEAKRQQEADEKKRRAEEAEQKRLAALEEKKHQQDEARAPRVASAEPPRHTEPQSPSPAPVSGKHKTLELVGFQQQSGASRVFVRTNEPVSYKVSEGRNEIVLMLENTQIGKGNNTRALDTSFFDTAVAQVDPTAGPDRSVRVSIKLKAKVSVQTHQEGNTISLEFPRPSR